MDFQPDVQMIVNAKFYVKVNVLKALSQVIIYNGDNDVYENQIKMIAICGQ